MLSDIIATMNTEFEIKFLDIAEDLVKNKLKEQKARQLKPKTLMKRQVFHPNKIDEAGDTWARVRDEGDKITMSVKHAVESNRIDCVKEAEVVVNSFAQACDLLLGLGLNPSSYQENYRETWVLGSCEVTIDTWPGMFCASIKAQRSTGGADELFPRICVKKLRCYPTKEHGQF